MRLTGSPTCEYGVLHGFVDTGDAANAEEVFILITSGPLSSPALDISIRLNFVFRAKTAYIPICPKERPPSGIRIRDFLQVIYQKFPVL